MTDWCHEFDFENSGDGGWTDWEYNGMGCDHVDGQGWKSGYRQDSGYDEQRISIRKMFLATADVNQIQVTYVGVFWDQVREVENLVGRLYLAGNQVGYRVLGGLEDGNHTLTMDYDLGTCDRIDLMMQCEAGYTPKAGGATITKVIIRGTGTNPFNLDEINHQTALDTAFNNLRDALHIDPNADIDTLVTTYKGAIEDVFGVTLDNDSGADDWADSDNLVPLHFARLGLEATALAFASWTDMEIISEGLCRNADHFDLFRRVTGGLTLKNVATEASNVAITAGKVISINRVPSENRQWRMTPNNLIHEIGHSFSRAAGYDTVKLGSIEQALEGNSLISGFTRDGMGPGYLRFGITQGNYSTLFYIHTQSIGNNNGTAVFVPNSAEPPLSPDNYLLYDIFGDKYDLWNSAFNHLGLNGRVDILVHNWPADGESSDMKIKEIVADAFLNWVQGSFEGTTGTTWQTFFDQNIGKFMRNAIIYWNGMSTHYIQNSIIHSTQTDARDFIQVPDSQNVLGWPNLRLIPVAGADDNLIGAVTISGRNPLSSKIYGWWQETTSSDIWLLVDSQPTDGKRLAWVIADGVDFESTDLVDDQPPLGNRILDYSVLNPDRAFSEGDLCTLLGLLIAECAS